MAVKRKAAGTERSVKIHTRSVGLLEDVAEEENLEEERLRYEEERNRILEENRKRMQELGLPDLTSQLYPTHVKKIYIKHQVDAGFQPRRSARVASRVEGSKLPTTINVVKVKEEARKNLQRPSKPRAVGASTRGLERYREEHIKLLSSYEKERVPLSDVVHPRRAGRIYDSENSKTCHQCRQQTLGPPTWCGICRARFGQFCGDCLFTRYGENLLEANANINWVCSVCRGICNWSSCWLKRGMGWVPILPKGLIPSPS